MRLTFEIEEEDHKVLCKYIPHGLRKYAYQALIKGFVKELARKRILLVKYLMIRFVN